ncbi:MAG: zinc ribbon domain-containing protein [Bacteroidetes bacterium]|nr:zinc ribbon domain-containing protein [Bacteroidota bacterium]
MPVYEFKCTKCSTEFSELFPNSKIDLAAVECPECQSRSTERLFSVFATDSAAANPSASNSMPCGPHCGCHH